LLCCQSGGSIGTIEQQIRTKIFRDLLRNRGRRVGNCIDHRIGKARERHARWIDDVGLGVPLRCDGVGERLRERDKLAPRRSEDRFAIEQYRDTARAGIARLYQLKKPLSQTRASRPSRRFGRVKRLIFEYLGKNLTHWDRFVRRKITKELQP
jgi:hypothetical protein